MNTKIGAKSNGKPAAGYNNKHGCEVNVSFSLISLFVSCSVQFSFSFSFIFSTSSCPFYNPSSFLFVELYQNFLLETLDQKYYNVVSTDSSNLISAKLWERALTSLRVVVELAI